jgi:uncharacterized membrane protein
MESKAKLLGHSIHQMLNVFPLGLLVTSLIFDIIYRTTYNVIFDQVAFYNIAAGLILGVAASVFGYIDYSRIPKYTRAKRLGTFHGFGNMAVLLFFSLSWLMRVTFGGDGAPVVAVLASAVGVGISGVTAWLGREMVSRLGLSVSPGANLNAPSSLSDRPAHMPAASVPITGEGEGTVTAPEGEGTVTPLDEDEDDRRPVS